MAHAPPRGGVAPAAPARRRVRGAPGRAAAPARAARPSTAASVCCASSSSSSSCSSAAKPSRWPRRRSTSRAIALQPADAHRRPARAPRRHPRPQRRRAGRGQAAADGVRDAVPAGRSRGGGATSCATRCRSTTQARAPAPSRRLSRSRESGFAYVARKVDPAARQGGPGARPARRRQLTPRRSACTR